MRELAQQLEKTLTIRKIYSPHAGPYQEAMGALERKLATAVEPNGFSWRFTATRLLHEDTPLLERPHREDCFFFPLYRDGLRELQFSAELGPHDLAGLLATFEAERLRRLAPDEDLVAYLWRCDLEGVRFTAVDGIGEEEGEAGEGAEAAQAQDYRALVTELVEKIKAPAPPETGQTYAFVLDADVRLQSTDLRYDAATTRRAFADNPTVFRLTSRQVDALRAEAGRDDEAELLARFVDILLAMVRDGGRVADLPRVQRVMRQILAGLWQASEQSVLAETLSRLREAAEEAPDAAARRALNDLIGGFFTAERMGQLLQAVQQPRGISFAQAREMWDLAGEESWGALLDLVGELPDGELAGELRRYLRERLAAQPELLRGALADRRLGRVLAALGLLDPRVEGLFARELLALLHHSEEAVRVRALVAAGRMVGEEANAALWRALQADPSPHVRLLALRLLSARDRDELVGRLRSLVAEESFAQRSLAERRRIAQLLAAAVGEEAVPLFLGWLPARRFLLRREEVESAALAVDLLSQCGAAGQEQLRRLASGRGRVARLARAARGAGASR
jgi:hypothetical protein